MTVHQVACAIVAGPPLALCAIWLTHDLVVAARSARRREGNRNG